MKTDNNDNDNDNDNIIAMINGIVPSPNTKKQATLIMHFRSFVGTFGFLSLHVNR